MGRLIAIGIAIALGVILAGPGRSQTNPGFNPNLQWCGTQGSLAIRGAANWQCLLPGTNGQALLSGGPGANPVWSTLTGTGTVTSVQASGGTTGLTFSGGPITGAGTLTLGGTLNIANGGIYPLGSANMALTYDGTSVAWRQTTGAYIGTGNITNGNIANATIATAKLAAIPALSIVANATGVSAVPTTPTLGDLLDATFSNTQGSILYRNVGGWSALPPGTAGQYLQTTGAGGNPLWSPVAGGPGVGSVVSVTCGTGLTGGTITTSGTCAIDAGAIPGTATNSSASAGNVGQEIVSNIVNGSAVSLPSGGTATNITSIVLTAGDWDISAQAYVQHVAATTVQNVNCSISGVSASLNATSPWFTGNGFNYTSAGYNASYSITPQRISLSSTTTYYLVCLANASANGSGFGAIRARRMR